MISRSFLPSFTVCILLLNILSVVDARTIQTRSSKLLDPIQIAASVLCALFCLFFAVMALSTAGKFGNNGKPLPSDRRGETYLTGKLYFFSLFLAFLCLVAYYALSAVTIVINAINQSHGNVTTISSAFTSATGAMLPLAHWFILCALLVLLFRRERVGRVGGPSRRYLYKFIFDLVLLGTHLSILIAASSLQGALRLPTDEKGQVINRLNQTLLALQGILTLDVVVSAVWMWMALKANSIPDSIMIGQIVKYIAPLLVIQEIYRITDYALSFTLTMRANSQAILSALLLSRIIIMGVTNFVILWFAV